MMTSGQGGKVVTLTSFLFMESIEMRNKTTSRVCLNPENKVLMDRLTRNSNKTFTKIINYLISRELTPHDLEELGLDELIWQNHDKKIIG